MNKILLAVLFGCFSIWIIATFCKSIVIFGQHEKRYETYNSLKKEKTDILKGIAILGIFISHIVTHMKLDMEQYNIIIQLVYYILVSLGDVGVAIFFFMSGYGNGCSLEKSTTHKKTFIWFGKHVVKIIFAFLVIYVLTVIVNMFVFKARISLNENIRNLVTLSLPGTVTWYLKIQLLLYVFTIIAMTINFNRRLVCLIISLLSLMYSVLMYIIGFENFWWQTSLCYALGFYTSINRENLAKRINKTNDVLVVAGSVITTMLFYIVSEFVAGNNFILRIAGFTGMTCAIMILVYKLICVNSGIFAIINKVLGQLSLEIYLVHVGIVTYCFNLGVSTIRIIEFVLLTIILTICAHWIIDKVFNKHKGNVNECANK